MFFCEEFFKSVHHLFNLTDLFTKIKNSDDLNLSEVMMMKRKINHLGEIKHKYSICSLNTLSVNPLAIAVYSVLAGMSLTASADTDTTTQSPARIDATLPLPNGNNRVTSFTTSPATITVTSSGVVNYPEADTNLSCSKLFVDGSNDGNSITSYGTINGSTNNLYGFGGKPI